MVRCGVWLHLNLKSDAALGLSNAGEVGYIIQLKAK